MVWNEKFAWWKCARSDQATQVDDDGDFLDTDDFEGLAIAPVSACPPGSELPAAPVQIRYWFPQNANDARDHCMQWGTRSDGLFIKLVNNCPGLLKVQAIG